MKIPKICSAYALLLLCSVAYGQPKQSIDLTGYVKNQKPVQAGPIQFSKEDKGKPFLIVVNNAGSIASNLKIYNSENDLPDDAVNTTVDGSSVQFDLTDALPEPGHSKDFIIGNNDKKSVAATFQLTNSASDETVQQVSTQSFTWSEAAGPDCCCTLDLRPFYLTDAEASPCKEDCKGCEDDFFKGTKRLVYDAARGITTYIGNNNSEKQIGNAHRINLRYNDPLLFIVKNANPAVYDVVLTDTAISYNLEASGLLNRYLFGQTGDGFDLVRAKEEDLETESDKIARYKCMRASLIKLSAEIRGLLDNFRTASPYVNNCIEPKKSAARAEIDKYLKCLVQDDCVPANLQTIVAMYLNPEDKIDSTLADMLQAGYAELLVHNQSVVFRIPQVPKCDKLDFKLSITAKNKAPYGTLLPAKNITQSAFVNHHFKVDVSSGLYLGFMRDQNLRLRADSVNVLNAQGSDSTVRFNRIIEEENSRTPEFGFASFLHFYYKFSHSVNIGGAIGVGLSFTETIKPRYFTGLSMMFGADNRICVNGGVVWGNYRELSNEYSRDPNERIPFTQTQPAYQQRFRNSGFISVSYSLPFITRKKAVASIEQTPKDAQPAAQSQGDTDGDKD